MKLTSEQYYKPPTDEIFEDIKQACIEVWKTYDDTHKYATEKINKIKDLKNISDNYGYMAAMFDTENLYKLYSYLKRQDAKDLLKDLV